MDIYQDRVEIGNPGGLYGGRTVANLDEGIPVSRNKVLANLLRSVPRPYGRGVVAEAAGGCSANDRLYAPAGSARTGLRGDDD